MKTYKDTISGETLYVERNAHHTAYYKDKAMTIYHRVDGPAIEWNDDTYKWYRNGKVHCMSGPAIVWPSGGTDWYVDGVRVTGMRGEYFGPYQLQDKLNDIKYDNL